MAYNDDENKIFIFKNSKITLPISVFEWPI